MLPLEIFPPGGLSTSVITCVWAGVFVVAFFNLRFGWVLTGLVVPGYVVPLLLLKPWSAFAVFVEGVVTYLLVWFLSERVSQTGAWCRLFGRDRFFALVVASIAVRLFFDANVFPVAGAWATAHFGFEFDYEHDLHSLGLIVVALLANIFWKPGLVRGTVTVVVTVGITFVIVRYGFMELTNFHITDLQYAYEDLASSILASPKAYIILVCTALIASRMNLFYGWEYNGILMPSLIALQWYQPLKIATSFGEALCILAVASAVLRLPLFANVNIEGARKLLLFFNIGFAYKLVLSFVLVTLWPEIKVSDAFAFGYLLSTLLAIKMHDKAIIGILTRATLQTSLTAVLIATLIGFGLTYVPSLEKLFGIERAPGSAAALPRVASSSAQDLLRRAAIGVYARHGARGVPAPTPVEIAAFEEGLRIVDHLDAAAPRAQLAGALYALHRGRYDARWVQDRYIYLEPLPDYPGRGLFLIDTHARGALVVEAPAAADERRTLDAALWLFERSGARALLVAGTYLGTNSNRSMDTLYDPRSYFAAAHRVVSRGQVVQVRGSGEGDARAAAAARSAVWVTGSLPRQFDLGLLETAIGAFDVHWGKAPGRNVLRERARREFAEIFLTEDARRAILAGMLGDSATVRSEVRSQRIDGYVQDWLLGGKERLARRGTDAYRPPTQEELLYLDDEIFTPLVHAATAGVATQGVLDTAAAAASLFGYDLVHYRHRRTGSEYLIFQEREGGGRFWGTFVLRLGAADNYIVQVPRPIYEMNSFEYAVPLFERLRARALIIAGAHPLANRDGSADLARLENIANPFNLATQVLLRESAPAQETLIVHSRAFGLRLSGAQPAADVLVAFGGGLQDRAELPAIGTRLLEVLDEAGLAHELVSGSRATAGYEVGGLPQALYPAALEHKHFVVLWLSPFVREQFRQQTENRLLDNQFRALGIASIRADLIDLVERQPTATIPVEHFAKIKPLVARYIDNDDVVSLYAVRAGWPDYVLERVIDLNSRQAFLVIRDRAAAIIAVANLSPLRPGREAVVAGEHAAGQTQEFVETRAGWLRFGGQK